MGYSNLQFDRLQYVQRKVVLYSISMGDFLFDCSFKGKGSHSKVIHLIDIFQLAVVIYITESDDLPLY
jgi:hypothetical protein